MIWNGKETGGWQIPTVSMENYREVFSKLRKLGFVFTEDRIEDADTIFHRYGYDYPYIVIGHRCHGEQNSHKPCKMTLTGFKSAQLDFITMPVDDWIANCWPAYDAA